MTDPDRGTPPKSAAKIRASLQSIHETADVERQAGPHVDGFHGDYPIAVATLFNLKVARSLQQLLSQSGIYSRIVCQGRRASVYVDNDDRIRAAQLCSAHRDKFPNRLPKNESRRFDFLIFGIAIGITLGGVILAGVKSKPEAVAIALTFTGIGAAAGHLLDRIRMEYFRERRFRFGIWEMLIATSIFGMTILAIGFLNDLFSG